MLKITEAASNASSAKLALEGQIRGPWVDELASVCEAILASGKRLALDFSAVTYVDERGVCLVRRLARKHVRRQNCSAFVSGQLKAVIPCQSKDMEAGRYHE